MAQVSKSLASLMVIISASIFGSTGQTMERPQKQSGSENSKSKEVQMLHHPYIGMWVTDDNRVRHELLPDNRYDEARGNRESAYQGRYEVTGNHIEYWDDTGFTADGDFVDENTLHHGGMILRRK
ncbi:Atu4866 domain-containing protein [Phyllobacterium sp. YR531]|uniref:Atu4866 domain-containing protein n=1 Tax=Phyllobacterium sp. YR531 TaxID=1144343 RepID=UPI0009DA968C|nr:Atu4866 domain-containing protein [Phyllobacterium sp. YR531]